MHMHIYTKKYYSAVKKNETVKFASKWIKPEKNKTNEVIQT